MKKNITYIVIVLLLVFSAYNIYILIDKKSYYNEENAKYNMAKEKYEKLKIENDQIKVSKNKERYFRQNYNVSKDGEVLFKFPEDEDYSG